MPADIAQRGRAQQRIGNGVQQYVGVAVAQQPFFMRDIHSAQDKTAAFHQPVRVVAVPDARHAA